MPSEEEIEEKELDEEIAELMKGRDIDDQGVGMLSEISDETDADEEKADEPAEDDEADGDE